MKALFILNDPPYGTERVLAHLNHHNKCTFLVEISERSAQVVCADGCCVPRPPSQC